MCVWVPDIRKFNKYSTSLSFVTCVCVETINLRFLEFELRLVAVWCGWETDIRNSDKSVPLGARKYRQTHWFGMDGDDADSMTRMNDDPDDLDGNDLKALKMKC